MSAEAIARSNQFRPGFTLVDYMLRDLDKAAADAARVQNATFLQPQPSRVAGIATTPSRS